MTCDPAGNKNWFLKWHLIDDIGRVFLYREWPDFKTYGEWTLPGNKPDGIPGPAQTSGMGKSILSYKKLILEAEGWVYDDEIGTWLGTKSEEIYERLIDPRFGFKTLETGMLKKRELTKGETSCQKILEDFANEFIQSTPKTVVDSNLG